MSLIYVTKLEIPFSKYSIILLALIWFFFWLRFFTQPKRFRKILHKFKDETVLHEILGGIGVILYTITSFVVLITTAST
jgi:hypothetical protein